MIADHSQCIRRRVGWQLSGDDRGGQHLLDGDVLGRIEAIDLADTGRINSNPKRRRLLHREQVDTHPV